MCQHRKCCNFSEPKREQQGKDILILGVISLNVRVMICTVAGLCAVLILLAMTPNASYLPHGMVLPEKNIRAPISVDQVTIYEEAPAGSFKRLGSVRAEIAFSELDSQTRDQLLDKVKSMAASIGGNGVVVKLLVPSDGVRHVLTLMGTIIYIPGGSAHS